MLYFHFYSRNFSFFFFFLIALHGIRLLVPQPQGQNLSSLQWKHGILIYWTTSEVPEDIL